MRLHRHDLDVRDLGLFCLAGRFGLSGRGLEDLQYLQADMRVLVGAADERTGAFQRGRGRLRQRRAVVDLLNLPVCALCQLPRRRRAGTRSASQVAGDLSYFIREPLHYVLLLDGQARDIALHFSEPLGDRA